MDDSTVKNVGAPTTITAAAGASQDMENSKDTDTSRLAFLSHEVDLLLSDYGLSRHPNLLEKARQDQSVSLQDVASYTQADGEEIMAALEAFPSPTIEVNAKASTISRKLQIPSDIDQVDWASRTFYVENIPKYTNSSTTVIQIQQLFSALLNTGILAVRFPLLFEKGRSHSDRKGKSREKEPPSTSLPQGGGVYKNFAFIVINSDEAAEMLLNKFKWDKSSPSMSDDLEEGRSDSEEEDEDMASSTPATRKKRKPSEYTLEELAMKSNLRALPIKDWYKLRREYLQYQRTLQRLYEESNEDERWNRDDARKKDAASKAITVSDWRTARTDLRNKQQELELVQAETRYPEGCVVEVSGLDPNTSRAIIKELAESVLKVGGAEGEKVTFVEWTHGSTLAEVRCSSAGAAVALKLFFQGQELSMADENTNSFDKLIPRPVPTKAFVQVQILEGDREKDFWSRVAVDDRQTSYTKLLGREPGENRSRRGGRHDSRYSPRKRKWP